MTAEEQGTGNPFAAPETPPGECQKQRISKTAVVWVYLVAAASSFALWMASTVILMVIVPQKQLQWWQGIGAHLLLGVLAILLARQHVRSALKELRESDIEPDGE